MSKRIDRTQPGIVRTLRRAGCFVQSLADVGKGCPDLLCARAGQWFLLEVKDGMAKPSAQRLTPAEKEWHLLAETTGARVHIVRSEKDALKAVGL